MSKFVDERIVEMSFDNKKFESNVKTSMGTLDKLKDSLDFSDAKKGFSALEIAAVTAIATITNKIVNMGIELAKNLTGIDQLAAGWNKFQEAAISEATLLAQFGPESADRVSESIEKLLWFTDETSYSFSDMMSNMSKFTAAGIGLEEAQNAMMGIANWAALSGQNAGVASRAMYQLSQAMGSGVIRLNDWRSIETANMATQEFKDQILATAVAMGTLHQNIDGTYTTLTGKTFEAGQFRDFLSEGFLTSDVLTTTLDKYSAVANEVQKMMDDDSSLRTASKALDVYEQQINDLEASYGDAITEQQAYEIEMARFGIKAFRAAQEARTFTDAINSVKDAVSTGWTRIFMNIFGGVEEAKVLWTDLANELYDVFMDGMWKKIDILGVWAENGGRDDLWANTEENTGAFWNLFYAIKAIKDLIDGAWNKVFGFSQLEDYDENVSEIADKLKTFTERLKEWTSGLFLSEEATETLTNILTGFFSILKAVGKTIIAVAKGLSPLLGLIRSFAGFVLGIFGDIGKEVTSFVETTTMFEKITYNMQAFFNSIINFVKSLKLLDGVKIFVDALRKSFTKTIGDTNNYSKMLDGFKVFIGMVADAFRWLGDVLTKYVLPYLPRFFEILGTGLGWIIGMISNLFGWIGNLIGRFKEWAKNNEIFQNGLKFLKNTLIVVGNAFSSLFKNIVGFFGSFKKVNTEPVEEFTEDVEKKFSPLQTFITGLGNLFQGLWHVVKAVLPAIGALFNFVGKALTFVGDKLKEIFTNSDGSVNFQKIFSVGFWSLVVLGIIRFADMLRSITQVFRDAFDGVFDYFNSAAMKQYMEAIRTMAISILLMVGALLILGMMDTDTLIKSMTALGVLIGFIVTTMILMKQLINVTSSASSKGLFRAKDFVETRFALGELGLAFLGLGAAILLLALALKKLGSMKVEELVLGLTFIALLMGMLVIVAKSVEKTEKGTNKAVKSMVKMAISIALLARPLTIIGSIDTTTGIKGLIGIGVLMALLTGYSRYSQAIDKSQKPINGLLTTAIALNLLIIPLKLIGDMHWIPLVTAFGVIAGLFTTLVIVSKIMKEKDVRALKTISEQLTTFAFGIMIFGFSMLVLGMSGWETIGKTGLILLGLFVLLSELGQSLSLKDSNRITEVSKVLAKFGVAVGVFGISMLIVGLNSWDSIWKTIVLLGGVFLALTVMNKLMGKQLTKPRVNNMTRIAWAMIPLSAALGLFGVALSIVSKIPWKNALISLGIISGVMLLLVGLSAILKLLGSGPGQLALMGVALISLSTGLLLLSVALLALGNIPLNVIGIGGLVIAGMFILLAAAAWVLKPVIWVIMALAGSIAVFAVGIFLLVTALTMLVGIMTVSSAVVATALISMAGAFIIAAPMIMQALWVLVSGVLEIIIKSIPLLGKAFTTLILTLLDVIKDTVPALVDTIIVLVYAILDIVATLQLDIIDALFSFFIAFLDVFGTKIPELVDSVVGLLINFSRSLRARLPELMIELGYFTADFIDGWVEMMILLIPRLANAGFDLIIGLLDGIGQAIEERSGELRDAIGRFLGNIWQAFLNFFGINSPSTKFMEAAGHMISGLLQGLWNGLAGLITGIGQWVGSIMTSITNGFKAAINIGKDLVNNIAQGAKQAWEGTKTWFSNTANSIGNFFGDVGKTIKNTGSSIINNVKSGAESVWNNVSGWFTSKANSIGGFFTGAISGMKSVGSDLINGMKKGLEETGKNIKNTVTDVANNVTGWFKNIFGIKSPSRVFAEMGMYLDLGLAKGIKDHSDVAYNAAENLGDDTVDGFERSGLSKVLMNLNDSLQSDFDNEIVIRPVLDLSEIQNGKNNIYDLFSDMDGYAISGSNDIAGSTRDQINRKQRVTQTDSKSSAEQQVNPTEITNNTFNITGSNPKEIAEEVSRVLQNNVDRRKARNGLVKV